MRAETFKVVRRILRTCFLGALGLCLLSTDTLHAVTSFVATGSLATPRYFHTATLLPNGKVLVAGGSSRTGEVFGSAEVYDPAVGTFTATGSMSTMRSQHTATLLSDGTVLIVGGITGQDTLPTAALIYNPATGTFASTGSLVFGGRYAHTATMLADGTVLITGGIVRAISAINPDLLCSNLAEIYDPTTGHFSPVGSMSARREAHTATLLDDGRVLIAGGFNGTAYHATAELYDPIARQFSSAGTMSMKRRAHTATKLDNGSVLLAGGSNTDGTSASADLYDPTSGTFTAVGSMTVARSFHTATLLGNGTVLVAGGYTPPQLRSAEIYDPATSAFQATGSLARARDIHTATLLPNGSVLVAGGNGLSSALPFAELYQLPPTTLAISAASGAYGSTVSLSAALTSGGSGVMGRTVSFTMNGAGLGSAVTDSSGVATLTGVHFTSGMVVGSYPIGASFAGDGISSPSSATSSAIVTQAAPTIAVTGGGTFAYDAQPHGAYGTATGAFGETLGPVTVTYTNLADSSVSASAPTAPGSYGILASYGGDTNYLAGTENSATITIFGVLTVVPPSHGSIAAAVGGINCGTAGTACTTSLAPGTPITLSSTADSGYVFGGWGGACAAQGLAPACALTMTAGLSASAVFNPRPSTLVVNAQADDVDARPGDGVCATATGACTLRASIQEANALAGADTILFDPSLNGTPITLMMTGTGEDASATGDLDVSGTLTIAGQGGTNTVIQGCDHGANPACSGGDRIIDVLDGASLALRGVMLRNGHGAGGGAIRNGSGAVMVIDSTIAGNTSSAGGGAIMNGGGTVMVTNSTISGNTAAGHGGGIASAGTATLASVTMTGNIADVDGNNDGDGGGLHGTATIQNSLIAGNVDRSAGDTPLVRADCAGTLNSRGYNLIGDGAGCAGPANGVNGDIVGSTAAPIDPRLGPLQNNGGPTLTHGLRGGSLAVDAGDPAGCTDAGGAALATDQRGAGFPRNLDADGDGVSRCDIGAYELLDGTPPVLTLPDNIVAEATRAAGAVVPFSASSSDNVDSAPVVTCTPASGSTFAIQTTTVRCSSTDATGNTATGSFTVTVHDTTKPAITAPAAMTVEATGSVTTVNPGQASGSDLAGEITITRDHTDNQFPLGTTVITWTATDGSGNTASAQQEVHVVDTTKPAITAPAAMTVEATGSVTTVNPGQASGSDLAGEITITRDHTDNQFPLGTTVITWTATDGSGNTASAQQQVKVVDTTKPAITAPAAMTVEATGSVTTVNPGQASGSDLAGEITITRDHTDNHFPLGTTVITWTATDGSGNTASAQQEVQVVDTTKPAITAPAAMTVEATGSVTTVNPGQASGSDLAGEITITRDHTDNQFPLGTTVITWTATDGSGNTASAQQQVKVVDTTKPAITAPAAMTVEATGPLTTINLGQATGSDSIGPVTITRDRASNDFALGTTVITWTATDGAGNTASAQQQVRIVDTTKPSLTLPANLTVGATSLAGTVVTYAASATDIVNGSVTVMCSKPSGSTFPLGTSQVSCSAVDAANNSVSGSFTVQVEAGAAYVVFLEKLQKIQDELNAAHAPNVNGLCGQIGALIHHVAAQVGKELTVSEANTLTTEARRLQAAIGCRE